MNDKNRITWHRYVYIKIHEIHERLKVKLMFRASMQSASTATEIYEGHSENIETSTFKDIAV